MSQETVSVGQDERPDEVASEPVTDDTAATPEQAQETQAPSEPSEGAESQEPQDAELSQQAFYDSLPPEKKQEMHRYFTQRTQKLSAREKELEATANIVQALQNDPQGTVAAMAKQLGLKVEQSPETQAAQDAAGQMRAGLEQMFGPEVAEKLVPALERIAEDVTKRHLAPIQEWQTQTLAQAAQTRAQAALQAFESKHPDWKQYESGMQAAAQRLRPADGVSEAEWLDTLYSVATADARSGDATKRAVQRIAKSAAAASPPASGVPQTRVAPSQPRDFGDDIGAAVRAAFAAANQGVRWEQ